MQPDSSQKQDNGQTLDVVLASLAGVASSVISAATMIRSRFYETVIDIPEVAEITNGIRDRVMQAQKNARAGLLSRPAMLKEIGTAKHEGSKAFADYMESMHYRSHGIKGWTLGSIDRLQSLNETARNSIVISASIAAGVAVGGLYTALSHHRYRSQQQKAPAAETESAQHSR